MRIIKFLSWCGCGTLSGGLAVPKVEFPGRPGTQPPLNDVGLITVNSIFLNVLSDYK